jgi:hypothetical protein
MIDSWARVLENAMMRRTASVIALLMSIASGISCTTTRQSGGPGQESGNRRQPTSFEEAELLAQHDSANPDTLEWQSKISARLGPALSVTYPCAAGIAVANVPAVDVVVKLSLQGKATGVFAQGTSDFAKCFGERLRLLDVGSAPWDGYWLEIRMQAPVETHPLSLSDVPCVPVGESTGSATPALTITKTAPSSGSSVHQSDVLTISLSYSVPAPSSDQYKLIALLETTVPGRSFGSGPVDFPYPATCGKQGSVMATIPFQFFWNVPNLPNPIRIRFAIATGLKLVAVSDVVEFSRQQP